MGTSLVTLGAPVSETLQITLGVQLVLTLAAWRTKMKTFSYIDEICWLRQEELKLI